MPSAEEFETAMRRHVLDAWFPRCLDPIHGGFLCDFDRSWASCGPHDKLLEFQARQTLMAADACRRYTDDQRLRQATLHGLRYLEEVMWDGVNGGLVSPAGSVWPATGVPHEARARRRVCH